MSARVVARENPFTDDTIEFEVEAGQTIADVCQRWLIPDWCYVATAVNGETCSNSYEIQDGDLITVKFIPGAGVPLLQPQMQQPYPQPSGKSQLGGAAIGALAMGAQWFLSRESQRRTGDSDPTLTNPLMSQFNRRATPNAPLDSFGGAKDRNLYLITGVANREDPDGPIPYIAGRVRVFPKIAAKPYTSPNGMGGTLRGALCVGFGELVISDIKIGDKPIADTGVTYQVRNGTSGDSAVTLYEGDREQDNMQEPLKANSAVTRQTLQAAQSVGIDIAFDNGLYTVTNTVVNGVLVPTYSQASVQHNITIQRASDGLVVYTAPHVVSTMNQGPFTKHYEIPVPRDVYNVTVVRATAVSTSQTLVNATSLIAIRAALQGEPFPAIYDQKGNRIYYSTIAFIVDGTEKNNGVLSEFNCIASHKVSTWSGGVWGAPVEYSYPAFRVVDMLCSGAFNSAVDRDTEIDAQAFKDWHDECVARGLTFNYCFDTQIDIEDAIAMVAAAGRATVMVRDGKYTVVMDKQQSTARQLFTPANTKDYTWHKAFPKVPQRLDISFINALNKYQPDMRSVYADGYSAANTNIFAKKVDAPGVVTPDGVYRLGRFLHRLMRLRPETHEFTTDIQQLVTNLGDKVLFRHDVPLFSLGDAHIKSVVLNGSNDVVSIDLDQAVYMEALKSYAVRIRTGSDNGMVYRTVNTVPGQTKTLTFKVPIPAATPVKPAANDLIAFGEENKETVEMVIVSIQQLGNFEARITLQDYAANLFALESEVVPPFDPQITVSHPVRYTPEQPRWLGIQSDETVLLEAQDGAKINRILITMINPNDHLVTAWKYRIKRSDSEIEGPWQSTPISDGAISILDVQDKVVYDIEIRALASAGKVSEPVYIKNYTCIGKSTLPPDPINLDKDADGRFLTWGIPFRPRDLAGYRIKFAWGTYRNWENMLEVIHLVTTEQANLALFPITGTFTVAVKSVDVAGNESADATYLVIGLGDTPRNNVINTILSGDSNFSDFVLTNCTAVGNTFVADDNSTAMWQESDTAPMWSADDNRLMWGDVSYKRATIEFTYTPTINLAGLPFRLLCRPGQELDVSADGYLIEYQAETGSLMWDTSPGADDLPFWSADADTPMWGSAEAVWRPFPGAIDASVQPYKFRITLFESALTQGIVNLLSMIEDMPDLREQVLNFVVDNVNGKRPTLGNSYRAIKGVQLTLKNDPVNYPDARSAEAVDEDAALGPLIKVFDAAHVETQGIVHVNIEGY
jgi:hypothetical protein